MHIKPPPNPRESLWSLIAYYLRFFREQHRMTGEQVGQLLGVTKGQVSKLEHGVARLDPRDAEKLDRHWGLNGLFGHLVYYATLGHNPQWFADYIDLEQRADVIRIFEAHMIPGLLQTEEYAMALIRESPGDHDSQLAQRLARQEILRRDNPPYLTVILSQAAVEWPIGSIDVMVRQLDRLVELSELPNVTIRVVPRSLSVGAYLGLEGSIRLMSGDEYGDLAYVPAPNGGRLVRSPREVRSYTIRFDRISAKALPEDATRDTLQRIKEELPS